MFGHDNNNGDDKSDVQINDELLQPEEQHHEEHGDGGAVEVAPSAPAVDDGGHDDNANSSTDNTAADDSAVSAPAADPSTNQLLDLKQQALQALSPLLGHLDQTPEEKFRTTMMLIQASDNQDLIKTAYEAAQAMGDEKAKAQALLDIVNEINYFTQKNG